MITLRLLHVSPSVDEVEASDIIVVEYQTGAITAAYALNTLRMNSSCTYLRVIYIHVDFPRPAEQRGLDRLGQQCQV